MQYSNTSTEIIKTDIVKTYIGYGISIQSEILHQYCNKYMEHNDIVNRTVLENTISKISDLGLKAYYIQNNYIVVDPNTIVQIGFQSDNYYDVDSKILTPNFNKYLLLAKILNDINHNDDSPEANRILEEKINHKNIVPRLKVFTYSQLKFIKNKPTTVKERYEKIGYQKNIIHKK